MTDPKSLLFDDTPLGACKAQRPTMTEFLLSRQKFFVAYGSKGEELHREPIVPGMWDIHNGVATNAKTITFSLPVGGQIMRLSVVGMVEGQEVELAYTTSNYFPIAASGVTLMSSPGALRFEM